MTTPERLLMRRRLEMERDRAKSDELARAVCEKEDRWVADFIANLAGAIGKIGRNKK
ncbi:hypothetical protein [Rhodopseudomonas sp.]|uniref:hypothetical protein n=1 Tax=Rhodopseudomonas sp. TaxID=1078 RepID=UPI0025E1D744|nr:hypothetical protein [Rhodopseudomonas sp.]